MEGANKKRSANFTLQDESLLVSAAKKYKGVLECKVSDTKTHKEKIECWTMIEKEFNSTSGEVFRPKDVLRKKYDNIKKRVKKKFADERCYLRGTGGGPSKHIAITDVDNDIKEMLGPRMEGMPSKFDGDVEFVIENDDNAVETVDVVDYVPQQNIQLEETEQENIFTVDHNYLESEPSTNMQDWSKYTPKLLRSKKSSALQFARGEGKKKDENIQNRVSQWLSAKSVLEESKQKFLEDENKLKLKCIQEKHDLELCIMRKKAEQEMQLQQREHDVKIEILQLQKAKLKK